MSRLELEDVMTSGQRNYYRTFKRTIPRDEFRYCLEQIKELKSLVVKLPCDNDLGFKVQHRANCQMLNMQEYYRQRAFLVESMLEHVEVLELQTICPKWRRA